MKKKMFTKKYEKFIRKNFDDRYVEELFNK